MERFPSKRDGWLVGVLLAGFGISCLSLTASLLSPEPVPAGIGAVLSILVAAALFIAWIWTATDYTLTSSDLLVRSGPFRWRVPLAEIQAVNPTRNPLSSPALSMDRLEVVYRRGSVLLISPQDKNRFLRSLVTQAPHLALRGDHVVRRG
jgi:hypothetical protein